MAKKKAPPQQGKDQTTIWKALVVVLAAALLVLGITFFKEPKTCSADILYPDHPDLGELLIGYKMLAHVLDQETQLKYLHLMRDATFRAPSEELGGLITLIHKTASKRKGELKDLRTLDPAVTAPPKKSKVGDGISDHAEASAKKEMVLPKGQFDMRFVIIQAQATRMIVAMAQSLRDSEYNAERKKWLKDLENEFEGIREQLIHSVETCHL